MQSDQQLTEHPKWQESDISDLWLINYILIRTAWLYGVNGKNFVQTILEKVKTTKKLTVVDDQVGSPTYTKDLAAAVDLLITQNLKEFFI